MRYYLRILLIAVACSALFGGILTGCVTGSTGGSHHLTQGDQLVYQVVRAGHEVESLKYEITGEEQLGEYTTWVFLFTVEDTSGSANPFDLSSKVWVDKDTGVVIKYETVSTFAQPQLVGVDGQTVELVESRRTATFDLKNNTMEETEISIDTSGKQHVHRGSLSANYDILMITRKLQAGDWYPWETADFSHQVTEETTTTVPAGTFDCWVIKHIQGNSQYYIEYYDKITGMLVKEENWVNSNGEWTEIYETLLNSLQINDR